MKSNLTLLSEHLDLPDELISEQENGGGVSLTHAVSLDNILAAMSESNKQAVRLALHEVGILDKKIETEILKKVACA